MKKESEETKIKAIFAGTLTAISIFSAIILLTITILFLFFSKIDLKYLSVIFGILLAMQFSAIAFLYAFFKRKKQKKK